LEGQFIVLDVRFVWDGAEVWRVVNVVRVDKGRKGEQAAEVRDGARRRSEAMTGDMVVRSMMMTF